MGSRLMRTPGLGPRAVPVDALRPTQMTIGLREVARKRREWRHRTAGRAAADPDWPTIPAVRGPEERFWILDAHHWARALHDEGVDRVPVQVVADLGALPDAMFRTYMDSRNWLYPFDAEGRRRPFERMPRHLSEMADDPCRSLASALRRAGGYAKDRTPFAECLWADYLRRHLPRARIEADFDAALREALALARAPEAAVLPGWRGGA